MLKNIFKIVKKFIMSFFLLYGYNVIVPVSAIIPINLITVLLITFFSVPALIFLIVIKITMY